MEQRQASKRADWLVTYRNPLSGSRFVLIDNIDEATADAVVECFGDNGEPYNRLPEVRKERAIGATEAASEARIASGEGQ